MRTRALPAATPGLRVKPVVIDYHPREWQRDIHNQLKRFNVLVVHSRAGKTILACMALVDAALNTQWPRAQYAYIAPYLKQAKRNAWGALRYFASQVPGTTILEGELTIVFPNGSRIFLLGADDPDALRGMYLDGVVLDEVAQMKQNVWGEIIRVRLADRKGWAIFIGTPKGINSFHERYVFAQAHPREWFSRLLTVDDTGVLAPEELESACESMTSAQVRQEFYCDFSAACDNQLIPWDLVQASIERIPQLSSYRLAARILGVDVARYGDDRSVIFPRQGLCAFEPEVYQDLGNMDLVQRIATFADEWRADAIFVDVGGGGGVIDRLEQLGYDVQGIDFSNRKVSSHYYNKRAEMWDRIRTWMEKGGCLPPGVPNLHMELCVPTYSYDNAPGKLLLEDKDDIRKRLKYSPDIGDALALTFAAGVRPRLRPGDRMRGEGGTHSQQRYDLLRPVSGYARRPPRGELLFPNGLSSVWRAAA